MFWWPSTTWVAHQSLVSHRSARTLLVKMTGPRHDTVVSTRVMCVTFCSCLVLLFFLPSPARALGSSSISEEQAETNCAGAVPGFGQGAPAPDRGHKEQHPRLFWIVPTYSVSNGKLQARLSSHEKFRIFVKNAVDPFTLGYTAIEAGVAHASDDLSGYGGAAGYGKQFGAGLADETSGGFFRTYVFSSMLHQDPRYFRRGSGPLKKRLAHAIIRPLITGKDSGGHAFNWSGLFGSTAASSLSNAYYPAGERGVGPTFKRVAFSIPSSVIDHLIDEFGPDLEKQFLRNK
jgi:hypothetical protein